MSNEEKPPFAKKGELRLRHRSGASQIRQNLSSGKSRTVTVEIKNRHSLHLSHNIQLGGGEQKVARSEQATTPRRVPRTQRQQAVQAQLKANRQQQLLGVLRKQKVDEENQRRAEANAAIENAKRKVAEREASERLAQEEREAAAKAIEGTATTTTELAADKKKGSAQPASKLATTKKTAAAPSTTKAGKGQDREGSKRDRNQEEYSRSRTRGQIDRRSNGKLTIAQAMLENERVLERRRKSLAEIKQKRESEKQQVQSRLASNLKVKRQVIIPNSITLQELASRMAERVGTVVKTFAKLGNSANPEHKIDAETAELLVEEFGHISKRVDDNLADDQWFDSEDKPGLSQIRPPLVTVMGHVDHGKTTLLDKIRKSRIAASESGGITQHIGAYQVQTQQNKVITFIDTPGHNAFAAMRARGADITDIVVLVVAADDGVQPQTREAAAHAKAANKPIIVAVNKIDLPGANPDKAKQDLLSLEIVVESLGGDVQSVEVSASTGKGIPDLLEAISLQAELLELTANPNRPALGRVLEARQEIGRGIICNAIIQRGTLKKGDIVVAGKTWGKVRTMTNELRKQLPSVAPSQPVEIMGFQNPPQPGDDLGVVANETIARNLIAARIRREENQANDNQRDSLQDMFKQLQDNSKQQNLNLIIKADVQGSLEAIRAAITKLSNDDVAISIIGSGIGVVSESDVLLAQTAGAKIIAFNVRTDKQANSLITRDKIKIFQFSVIYELIDHIKQVQEGLTVVEQKENILGEAELRVVYNIPKIGAVAGSMVTMGTIRRGSSARLIRDGTVVYSGKIKSLRRVKDDVREVSSGYECGICIDNYPDLKVNDTIECFELVN